MSADIVASLLQSRWCTEDDLSSTYAVVSSSDEPVAAAFLQLPFSVGLPHKWTPIPWEHGEPRLSCSVRQREAFEHDGIISNQLDVEDELRPLTQVRVIYCVWGRRRTFYDDYLREIATARTHSRKQLVSAGSSWLPDARPLTAETYESDLSARLYHETLRILKRVIRTYSVIGWNPYAKPPEKLANFFVMMKNGRVVVRPKHSLDGESDSRAVVRKERPVSAKALMDAFKEGRGFSEYERFLVDATRQIDAGNATMAIVQAVMILDWFANTILYDRLVRPVSQAFDNRPDLASFVTSKIWESGGRRSQIRVRTIEKFQEYFPLAGIHVEPGLLGRLKALIQLRNEIVHKRQAESVPDETAHEALATASAVIREIRSQISRRETGQLK